MRVLIEGPISIDRNPPILVQAIEVLRTIYGKENLAFDLEMEPFQAPVLVAYLKKEGSLTRLGPVR